MVTFLSVVPVFVLMDVLRKFFLYVFMYYQMYESLVMELNFRKESLFIYHISIATHFTYSLPKLFF